MEKEETVSSGQPQKSKFKLWVERLDFDDVQRYFLYFLILVQVIVVRTALYDAAFYCENYCTASGLEFSSYTNGDCRCVVNQTMQNTFNLNNISWNQIEMSNNSAPYDLN